MVERVRAVHIDFVNDPRTDRVLKHGAIWRKDGIPDLHVETDDMCDIQDLLNCFERLADYADGQSVQAIPSLILSCFEEAVIIETYSKTIVQVHTTSEDFLQFSTMLSVVMTGGIGDKRGDDPQRS